MLVMMLMAALMIGFTAVVTSDQRYRLIDRDRVKAFYGAMSGLEQLNADLANLFFVNVAPSASQIAALADAPPDIDDITFTTTGNGAYGVTAVGSAEYGHISSGPYEGLIALKTKYELDATARTTGGGEAHLRRGVETVAIPVFQFGMFSEPDLSFHAGANFNFGGRIHSNANLYLAQGGTTTLTLSEKVTAVGEIYRVKLVNGRLTSATHPSNNVRVATSTGSYRNFTRDPDEGSADASDVERAAWPTLSLSTYNGYIRDGTTGAKALNLPVITSGGANTDLVRRPAAGEDDAVTGNPTLLGERLFTQVSLRVLLSDAAADITSLPTVTATAPVELAGDWVTTPPNNGTAYGPVDATHPPIARSPGHATATGTVAESVGDNNAFVDVAGGLHAYWRIPNDQVTVTKSILGVPTSTTVTCTGKTETTFTGCTDSALGVAMPATVTATVDGKVMTANLTADWVLDLDIVDNDVITVDSTLGFAPDSFWIEGTNNLVTCKGYETSGNDGFIDCDISTAISASSTISNAYRSNATTSLVGGFLKIEMQEADGDWVDVTMQILNYGIGAPNVGGQLCADPTPDAIIRIQRLRDNNETAAGACHYAGSTKPTDWWPLVLFDPREALQRDIAPAATFLAFGGVMHYITLDVANLSKWFAGTAPYNTGTGNQALSVNGYSVYFSDRRNNRNTSNAETGEYGFEDVINPTVAGGATNDTLDAGEDVNASNALDNYGRLPSFDGASSAVPPCDAPCVAGNYVVGSRPTTTISPAEAKVNRAIFFRRALKLTGGEISGGVNPIISPGLTIVSENPVYVQGNWNASGSSVTAEPNVATAIIADSVTLLSSSWNDNNSFSAPYTPASRARTANSYYRFAVIAGKNAPFAYDTVTGAKPDDFGTDGGAHNFLRMLEGGSGTVNYRGSIATFYYSRQATGVYKCCTTVYGAPTRNFNFDADFLDPAKLPPLTPVFRDINALGFEQETRPGQ